MKKGMYAIFVFVLLVCVLTGCTQQLPKTEVKFTEFYASWRVYDSPEKLTAAATDIYEGKVTRVFFDVVDVRTGAAVSQGKPAENARLDLCTVYEVEVTDFYKGGPKDKMYFCISGGIKDEDRFTEQYRVMYNAGIYDEQRGVPVSREEILLNVGETYLFLTNNTGGTYQVIINSTQFAFKPDDTPTGNFTCSQIRDFLLNEKS